MVHRSRVALTLLRPLAWVLMLFGAVLVLASVGKFGKTVLSGTGGLVASAVRQGLVGAIALGVGFAARRLTRPPLWKLSSEERGYR